MKVLPKKKVHKIKKAKAVGESEVMEATSGWMSFAQFKALEEKIGENILPERMGKS